MHNKSFEVKLKMNLDQLELTSSKKANFYFISFFLFILTIINCVSFLLIDLLILRCLGIYVRNLSNGDYFAGKALVFGLPNTASSKAA
jgi:hypothetical protein